MERWNCAHIAPQLKASCSLEQAGRRWPTRQEACSRCCQASMGITSFHVNAIDAGHSCGCSDCRAEGKTAICQGGGGCSVWQLMQLQLTEETTSHGLPALAQLLPVVGVHTCHSDHPSRRSPAEYSRLREGVLWQASMMTCSRTLGCSGCMRAVCRSSSVRAPACRQHGCLWGCSRTGKVAPCWCAAWVPSSSMHWSMCPAPEEGAPRQAWPVLEVGLPR